MRSIALLFGVSLLQACSLSTYDRTECSETTECRDAFGFGSVCGSEGYCEVAELHPRCQTVFPADLSLPIDPETTYVVGSVFDHSLDTHVGRYQSAQLAAFLVNSSDGLDGRDFAMIHCTNTENETFDALDKTAASEEVAVWLAETVGVPAIIGPAASSRSVVVYNAVAEAYDTLIVSPSATSPSLTPIDGIQSTDMNPGLFWRTAPPDDLQGVAIAADMLNNFDPLGATTFRTAPSTNVGVVFQTGAYGEGLQEAFTNSFTAHGGQTLGFSFANETARADAIADAASGGFDEILFISSDSADTIAFLQAASTLETLNTTPLFLPDAARNSDVLDAVRPTAGDVFPRIRGTAPATPAGVTYDSFTLAYRDLYGGADVSALSFTAQSFDAMWLVIYGHAWAVGQHAGEINGTNLARGFRHVSAGDPVEIRSSTWNLVKAKFQNGQNIDVTGASGALDYAPNGETTATIDIWVIAPAGDAFDVVDSVQP